MAQRGEAAAPAAQVSEAGDAAPAAAQAGLAAPGDAPAQPGLAAPAWATKSLRNKCDCHMCRAGKTTELHADASHDQSLQQSIRIGEDRLTMTGGTTKCARVAVGYFASQADTDAAFWRGKHVLEVGAGTGLVGIALAALGAHVTLTDQQPMLELLQYNVDANANAIAGKGGRATVAELYFGAGLDAFKQPPQEAKAEARDAAAAAGDGSAERAPGAGAAPRWHAVIGSDLIYAKETIEPLIATYLAICSADASRSTHAYLVSIERFAWERSFFEKMAPAFEQTCVYQLGDIRIDRFSLKPPAAAAAAAPAAAAPAAAAASAAALSDIATDK